MIPQKDKRSITRFYWDKCTCRARFPRPDDIDPLEPQRDRTCPIHGDLKHVDPDAARERQRDREGER